MWGLIFREEEEEDDGEGSWECGSGEGGWWKPAAVRRREAGVEVGGEEDGVSREERRAESSASARSSWDCGCGRVSSDV